jgi:hypothetical protein
MALLVAFGFWHARRTSADEELTVHSDELMVHSEVTNGHDKVPESTGA